MFTLSPTDAAASTVSSSHATTPTVSAPTVSGSCTTTDKTTEPTVLSGSATIPPAPSQRPREQVRHLLFGTPSSIQTTIQLLHKLGYAEPNDWSRPLPTGNPNEMMAILTKRVSTV